MAQADSKLGLNGSAVDTVTVQALAHTARQVHVAFAALVGDGKGDLNVQRSDNLRVRKLPDVDMVAAENAVEILNVFANVIDANVVGGGLQQDLGSGLGQGDGRLENDEGDEERHNRVGIHAVLPRSLPNDKSRDNDTQVAQGVANDVQDHGIHAHVAVTVAMTAVATRFGISGRIVVVATVRITTVRVVVRVAMVVVVVVAMPVSVTIGAIFGRVLAVTGAAVTAANQRSSFRGC